MCIWMNHTCGRMWISHLYTNQSQEKKKKKKINKWFTCIWISHMHVNKAWLTRKYAAEYTFLSQKSPIFPQKSPIYFWGKRLILPQRSSIFVVWIRRGSHIYQSMYKFFYCSMTYSTEKDINPKSTTLLKSDSSVQSQIRPKFKFKSVPRDSGNCHTAETVKHTSPSIVLWPACTKQRRITCTGWRRLIGSPKLQIILHKRATKYRVLLRKMTYKDKGSYESSPPCTYETKTYTRIYETKTYYKFLQNKDLCEYLQNKGLYKNLQNKNWLQVHKWHRHITSINTKTYYKYLQKKDWFLCIHVLLLSTWWWSHHAINRICCIKHSV